jgi:hypothetical protein
MGLCHGAVILVSEAAMRPDSIWVPRETSILLWRRTLDSSFMVIPACLGTVRPEHLGRGVFGDMQLGEIQTAPADTPEQLAAALTARFAPLATPKTPLEVLASRLSELLQGVSDRAIEESLEVLPIDLGPCAPTADVRSTLALALLQSPLRESLPAVEVLAECMDGSKADQVLAIIAPSWVDLCAARWLADWGVRGDDKPAVFINAAKYFTARMYVYRASCRPPKTRWPVVNLTAVHGERAAQEIAAEVEQNLIREFRLEDDPDVPDPRASLRALLKQRQREGRPVFATLPFVPAIPAALPELQRLVPGVTFVVRSGQDFPAPGVLEGKRVCFVEPRLNPGAEEQAHLDFLHVKSIIRPQEAAGF